MQLCAFGYYLFRFKYSVQTVEERNRGMHLPKSMNQIVYVKISVRPNSLRRQHIIVNYIIVFCSTLQVFHISHFSWINIENDTRIDTLTIFQFLVLLSLNFGCFPHSLHLLI